MTTRVLLVDDQPLIRLGFAAILQSQGDIEVVGEAGDGAEGVERAAALDPDVICMDVQMPRMDGIKATRALAAAGTRAAVLILTTFDRDDFLFEALEAGASGFLLKSAEAEALIDAVRVLGRGDALLDPQVTRRVLRRMADSGGRGRARAGGTRAPAPGTGQVEVGAAVGQAGLTAREAEILTLMARGLSNAEIAAQLFVGESTVKTHVSHVLMKLGARDRVHAVIWAFEQGVAG